MLISGLPLKGSGGSNPSLSVDVFGRFEFFFRRVASMGTSGLEIRASLRVEGSIPLPSVFLFLSINKYENILMGKKNKKVL